MRRVLLVFIVGLVSLLLAEGALSLAGAPTLRAALFGGGDRAAPDEALGGGEFVAHPDPRVHAIMEPGAELEVAGVAVRADALGLRDRARPTPPGDATRIVLLGDSVVFGWGVGDDDVLAAQLERQLTAAAEPGAAFVVRGVGLPGWNTRNATSFLLDHLDRLDPDLVVHVPIPNDLTDAVRLSRGGAPAVAPDVASDDPWVHLAYNGPALAGLARRRAAGEDVVGPRAMGPTAIDADLGPESRRRYDAVADRLVATSRRLAERGVPFVVATYRDLPFTRILLDRISRRGGVPYVVPLFGEMVDGDRLPSDPHPNPDALGHMATWLARDLVASGLLAGVDPSRFPEVPDDVEVRRARLLGGPAALADAADAARDEARALLGPLYDTTTGVGARQGYGGVDGHGRVTTRARILLRPDGDELVVRAAPLDHRPHVPPVVVDVQVDDATVGAFTLRPGDGETTARFAWPPRDLGGAVDVTLVPADWVVDERDGEWSLASFRLFSVGGE